MVGSIDLLAAWAEDGDWVALGALADELDGSGDQPAYAALVRKVYEEKDAGILFFWRNGPHCYAPKDPLPADGQRLRAARLCAFAEHQMIRGTGEWSAAWEVDADADRSWMDPDDGRDLWFCVVSLWRHDHQSPLQASLGGIDLENDGPAFHEHARVVVAELALSLIHDDELPT